MRRQALIGLISTPFGFLVSLLVLMWGIEVVDTVVLDDHLQSGGIHPRSADGIDGILWAPFLHSGWGHIASNSVPWLALGGLVAVRGWRHWLTVTVWVALVGGGATWLLAGGGNHIGASGVIFGYFGALIGAAFFERRPATVGPALVVIMMYSSMLIGLVPRDGISWEGHLFGMMAGIAAARSVAEARPARPRVGPQPWEVDEPWLTPFDET
jgi:membrane associated rhomboid family serine protease